jgi:hypothetical protein
MDRIDGHTSEAQELKATAGRNVNFERTFIGLTDSTKIGG